MGKYDHLTAAQMRDLAIKKMQGIAQALKTGEPAQDIPVPYSPITSETSMADARTTAAQLAMRGQK